MPVDPKLMITLISALAATLIGVLVFFDFSPRVRLRILPTLVDKANLRYVLRLEVENISKVTIAKDQVRGCKLQILEHSLQAGSNFSEFVPFTREKHDERPPSERAKAWREPISILETTRFLYPGDLVIVERLISLPDDDTFLHVGFQFHGEIRWLTRIALRIQSLLAAEKVERWTTTGFLYPPKTDAENSS